jgi:predicted dienelactone hydrolase
MRSRRRWQRAVCIILLVLLVPAALAVSGVTYVVLRHHQPLALPTPTGPYALGRSEYDWIDPSRDDPLAPMAGTKRELVVWAWYPAVRLPGAPAAPYLPATWAHLDDQQHGVIGAQLQQSGSSIQTHSVPDAPLPAGATRYPVLIFAPGLSNLPTHYTTLLEDLASHGYVIFGITPTYSAGVVVFPDGRVVSGTDAGRLNTSADPQVAADQLIDLWSHDVRFVMDHLAGLNAESGGRFGGRLDLDHLGVFGHSFGGATAAEVCHVDVRCTAGIDLDGALAGAVVDTGLAIPFLVMQHDLGACSNAACQTFEQRVHAVLRTVPNGAAYHLSIAGTKHFNFADLAVHSAPIALQLLRQLGPIDGARGVEIVRAYDLAFFDTYLHGAPAALLQRSASPYPEVRFFTP